MELTNIKGSVFGYSKKGVCQYISELNDIHSAEVEAIKGKNAEITENLEIRIRDLTSDNSSLNKDILELTKEINELKETLSALNEEKEALNKSYEELLKETEDLREKSDVISTAIINAEKCASSMINDANKRAQDMIDDAEDKVAIEVKRLETAKTYIEEVRNNVELTLKKIDSELGGIVTDIATKATSVNSFEDRKSSVKDKFGVLEKSFFKRA